MNSKVKILGRPVHPMMVNFPIAFYVSTLIAFIIYNASNDAFWFKVGIAANVAGIVMALLAATFGFIDWAYGIPEDTAAKRTGVVHMSLNTASLILFLVNLVLNAGQWDAAVPVSSGAIILPLLGVIFTIAAGYFGWTLVQSHHVGVDFTSEEEQCMTNIRGIDKRMV